MKSTPLKWFLALAPILWLWLRLIDDLRFDWGTNPQYSYGWLVPFACIGLLLGRVRSWPGPGQAGPDEGGGKLAAAIFALLAFLYLPILLVEAATPEWTAIQWSLGFEAVAATLCVIYLLKGKTAAWHFAFPICFFIVAIPWPTFIENRLIQSLTRANAATAVSVLSWFNIPAMRHGNLIEVSTGVVGVDEACSGIRSLQTTLMISLFFGELYRLSVRRRFLLLLPGFVLAMFFNICRMSLLTWLAAKEGLGAISRYHDPAGIVIALLCAAGLWLLALLFKRRGSAPPHSQTSVPMLPDLRFPPLAKRFRLLSLAVLSWLILAEVGVAAWYRIRESHLRFTPNWSVTAPTENRTLKTNAIPETTSSLLGFDEGKEVEWDETDGSHWSMFYANWFPGRVAGYLAKRHTPELCMAAEGCKLVSGPKLEISDIKGAILPIKNYVFQTDSGPLYVIHCRWEAGVDAGNYVEQEGPRLNLLRAIWAGRGNQGQKVLEVVVSGYSEPGRAHAAFARQLKKLVVVEKPEDDLRRAENKKTTYVSRAETH